MNKLYLVALNHDLGELWLDEHLTPIKHVDANDARFDQCYHGFIFEELGAELIYICLSPTAKENKAIEKKQPYGDAEAMFKIFKKSILKLCLQLIQKTPASVEE